MKISTFDNLNFRARLKIDKTKIPNLIQAATVGTLGSASIVTGGDIFIPNGSDLGVANSIIESARNVHEVDDGITKDIVANNDSAISTELSIPTLIPSGSMLMSTGLNSLAENFNIFSDSNK